MTKTPLLSLLTFSALLLACSSTQTEDNKTPDQAEDDNSSVKAEEIIQLAYEAHGGELYETAEYSFNFRDKIYTFRNSYDEFAYSRLEVLTGQEVLDEMTNEGLTRHIDGEEIDLDDESAGRFSESINSVIYFATLPHKLTDEAVNLELYPETTIKGLEYQTVKVTFDQEGGGTDFEDEYMYWFRKGNYFMDYLAYNFQVNGGGVRFRAAFNQRNIDGIRFQDYENYSAEVGTNLEVLPALYEANELEQVSIIATENVVNLNAPDSLKQNP